MTQFQTWAEFGELPDALWRFQDYNPDLGAQAVPNEGKDPAYGPMNTTSFGGAPSGVSRRYSGLPPERGGRGWFMKNDGPRDRSECTVHPITTGPFTLFKFLYKNNETKNSTGGINGSILQIGQNAPFVNFGFTPQTGQVYRCLQSTLAAGQLSDWTSNGQKSFAISNGLMFIACGRRADNTVFWFCDGRIVTTSAASLTDNLGLATISQAGWDANTVVSCGAFNRELLEAELQSINNDGLGTFGVG